VQGRCRAGAEVISRCRVAGAQGQRGTEGQRRCGVGGADEIQQRCWLFK
jgi:hypothetical protein